ncbi:DUF202 domain-containing protein [Alteromonas gracilis]
MTQPAEPEDTRPDYRFSLANERTFLAWVRTSLGLLAGGVAVTSLLPQPYEHPVVRLLLGGALLLLACLVPLLAYRRWSQTETALRTQRSLPSPALLRLVAGSLTLVGLLVIAILLI